MFINRSQWVWRAQVITNGSRCQRTRLYLKVCHTWKNTSCFRSRLFDFSPLAPVPNSLFWKVCLALPHTAGCFKKTFFHTAIKCNFSHQDKNVYQNESTDCIARDWKHKSKITQNEAAFFSCNFKRAGIREQKNPFCFSPMLDFAFLHIVLHGPFHLHLHLLLDCGYFSKQVELALPSVSVLSSSGMPRAREKTGGEFWVLKC